MYYLSLLPAKAYTKKDVSRETSSENLISSIVSYRYTKRAESRIVDSALSHTQDFREELHSGSLAGMPAFLGYTAGVS